MVLDQDGKNISKVEVGKNNEAHAVAFAPDTRATPAVHCVPAPSPT
jgi:hypothetical protein